MAFPLSNKGWKVWLLVQLLQMYDNMSNIYTSQKEKKEKTPIVFVKSWTCMQPSKKILTNIQVIRRLLRIALQSHLKGIRKMTRKMVERWYVATFPFLQFHLLITKQEKHNLLIYFVSNMVT